MGLSVAVTGPTGEIGRALMRALDGDPRVQQVVGIARRPFDPAGAGLSDKVTFARGDVLDRDRLDEVLAGVDVVVHLAFAVMAKERDSHAVNMRGSANVFDAAVRAGARRIVYTSSTAAYGFHRDLPQPLTEDVPARGSADFPYSRQKSELERVAAHANAEMYVMRPCIVAGADAQALIRALPRPARVAGRRVPVLKPLLPDPGVPVQLVHHDDVAAALVAGVMGHGKPGTYNLAAPGVVRVRDLARELGWHTAPLPRALARRAADAAAVLEPVLPGSAQALVALREPVIVDATRARTSLGWRPRLDAAAVLRETVAAARAQGVV